MTPHLRIPFIAANSSSTLESGNATEEAKNLMTYHPKLNDDGKRIVITYPSEPTPIRNWGNAFEIATVIPKGDLPPTLNEISLVKWSDTPCSTAGWEHLAGRTTIEEPPFLPPKSKRPAAGVVVEESDGRIWLVAPSNRYGGYICTFPKGTVEPGASRQATAIKEAFEESGLQVEITGFLADSDRSLSYTRYFLARRVGGTPTDMGWETQAVHLVPRAALADFLTHKNDLPLLKALNEMPIKPPSRHEILLTSTLTSATRIVAAINGYRNKHEKWPCRVLMNADMSDAIQTQVMTPLGWTMLERKVELVKIDEGTVIAEGNDGTRFEYDSVHFSQPQDIQRADVWIWGLRLMD